MRNILLAALCLAPCFLFSQTVDSTAIRQVDSLIQVSRALTGKQEFDKALEVNAGAEKLALEKLGQHSAAYASCCYNRGRVNYIRVNYPEAKKWLMEAKAIWEKALGNEHRDYARTLLILGWVCQDMGEYEQAELFMLNTKTIYEKILGKEHADYASSLNSLASLYKNMGDYEKAEPLYLEAIAIREKATGKEHPDYATGLNNLAILYKEMGLFEKAEPLYLEAMAIRSRTPGIGKKHRDYAASLNNLASFYMVTGNYEKAEPLFVESRAIREQTLGKEHPEYAASLNNLANVYNALGNYEKAEPLYIEAKDIWEKATGKEHNDYALGLSNLGNFYMYRGDYAKAEPLLLEAKAIRYKILGDQHPDYAITLTILADLNKSMGAYEKAEPLYFEAKAIWEKFLGKGHAQYAGSLNNLAKLYSAWGEYEKAAPFHIASSQANQLLIENAVRHFSERELGNYLTNFSGSQDQALSFAQLSGSKTVVPTCFDNALFYKGFLLHGAVQIKRLAGSDPTAAHDLELLQSCGRRLSALYAQPVANRDSATVTQLETQVNDLEKDLARTVAGFGQALRQVKWEEVQAALRPNEAAIEFVSYRFYQKKQTDSTFYAALVLQPGATQPQLIPLFEEKQLTNLLKTEGKPQPAFYNELYAAGKKGGPLYDLIWKPIAAAMPEGATVYCSPSGLLHRLNLGAIPTPDGKNLAEKNRLTMLGSTRSLAEGTKARQLAVPPVPAANQTATAQLYGGIQYDVTPDVAANTDAHSGDLASRRGPGSGWGVENDSTLRGGNWNYLRWTDVEISAAAEIMTSKGMAVTLKKGAEATEESFKSIGTNGPSPRILHVATHGFFFPDPGPLPAFPTRRDRLPSGGGEKAGEKTFKVSQNPMIRSGLVLAGGNQAWKTGKPLRPDLEDGILTAYEISQMNLSNTELAVLSACETGLGDLVGNEGVYGLQRAFKIAGVRYLIMSLWQVPDFQTQVFMTAFYKHWLEGKMAVPEAFRATQSELRAKYGDAFKWAGFVLVE